MRLAALATAFLAVHSLLQVYQVSEFERCCLDTSSNEPELCAPERLDSSDPHNYHKPYNPDMTLESSES